MTIPTVNLSNVISAETLVIGHGFSALAFREKTFLGAMDPLIMVDHYTMTSPTFGAHPHAGLSALSVLFEDSKGTFHNRDSLGNDFDLMPGDLYWLNAGSGVIHDEAPRPGAQIHGLQVFVNLPAESKKCPPTALHVAASSMPELNREGTRVRIVLGESNGVTGQQSPVLPMTILDGKMQTNGAFSHVLKEGHSAWIYVIQGTLNIRVAEKEVALSGGQSVALSQSGNSLSTQLLLVSQSQKPVHFVLFTAKPINEPFVQKGPFVMQSHAAIAQVEADYVSGKLGRLN